MYLTTQFFSIQVLRIRLIVFCSGFQILILLNSALIFQHSLTYMVFASTNFVRGLNYVRQESLVHHSIDNNIGTSSKKITLKITLQKSTFKFLFAEADSDFINFLFCFLEIPLGTVIGKLLNGTSCLQSMDNLYASISNKIVGKCIKSQDLKDMLLEPQLRLKYLSQNQIFPVKVLNSGPASGRSLRVSPLEKSLSMVLSWPLNDPRAQESYSKLSAKFMLTDDLVITPLSSTSTLAVLNKLKFRLLMLRNIKW